MVQQVDIRQINVLSFARSKADIGGEAALASLPRLAGHLVEDSASRVDGAVPVHWRLRGREVPMPGGPVQVWLDLQAQARVVLVCQRCLEPVGLDLSIRRSYRFVGSEKQAEAEDLDSDEDVLALGGALDALELLEDELLMTVPMVPMHDVCPHTHRDLISDASDGASPAVPARRPFAALAALKKQ